MSESGSSTTVSLDSQSIPGAEVVLPPGDGPHPAVILGAEAYGINQFIRGVAQRLTSLGFAAVLPDYYHGHGPTNTEAYDEFTEVIDHIGRLDFTCGARDLAGAIDAARARPDIDPRRVCVWGYCTGGTLAWLAACMRGDLAAAVLFFPSQPTFAELGPKTPVHPVDLIWQLTCPTLFIYGDQDMVMPPDLLADIRSRIERWAVDAEIRLYAGAGHAFSAPWGAMRNADADQAAWADAVSFVQAHTKI
jgi:carboxymethylenebutenolidase